MITKILAAIDSSIRAEGVFDAAMELATRFGAELSLLRVVDRPQEFPASAAGTPRDPLPDHLVAVARSQLEALAARAPALRPKIRIDASNEPGRTILAACDELDVDLIVIGSHGYRGIDRLLGTTAAKVVNLSRRSVYVVHDRVEETPTVRPSRSLRIV